VAELPKEEKGHAHGAGAGAGMGGEF
jgi:hypothetical protein